MPAPGARRAEFARSGPIGRPTDTARRRWMVTVDAVSGRGPAAGRVGGAALIVEPDGAYRTRSGRRARRYASIEANASSCLTLHPSGRSTVLRGGDHRGGYAAWSGPCRVSAA